MSTSFYLVDRRNRRAMDLGLAYWLAPVADRPGILHDWVGLVVMAEQSRRDAPAPGSVPTNSTSRRSVCSLETERRIKEWLRAVPGATVEVMSECTYDLDEGHPYTDWSYKNVEASLGFGDYFMPWDGDVAATEANAESIAATK